MVTTHLEYSNRPISITVPHLINDLPRELRTFSFFQPSLKITHHYLLPTSLSITSMIIQSKWKCHLFKSSHRDPFDLMSSHSRHKKRPLAFTATSPPLTLWNRTRFSHGLSSG